MLFLKIYRFLFGYVRFTITGLYPERLLNLLSVNSVSVWNVLRIENNVEANVIIRDYKRMHQLCRQSGCRVRCKERYGAPFFFAKYRKRLGAVVGALLFVVLLWFLSGRIWNIQIKGNETIEDAVVLNACRELGIYEGALRSSIDPKAARISLAIKLPDIAWASVNIEGSVLTVEISEAQKVDSEDEEPCNLKASVDGVIKAIEVTDGKVVVGLGDGVVKGDLLVSGIMEYTDGSSSFVSSKGEIIAETIREAEYFASYKQTKEIVSKKPIIKRVLHIFSLKIPLYIGSVQGDSDKVIKEKKIKNGNSYAPVYITEGKFYKKKKIAYILGEESALKFAKEKLDKQIEAEFNENDIEIVDYSEAIEVQDDGVLVKRSYKCLENIAKKEKILFGTTNP